MASKYIPKEQLASTDDCGFSPFAIDKKPAYGSPDFAREIALQEDQGARRRDEDGGGERLGNPLSADPPPRIRREGEDCRRRGGRRPAPSSRRAVFRHSRRSCPMAWDVYRSAARLCRDIPMPPADRWATGSAHSACPLALWLTFCGWAPVLRRAPIAGHAMPVTQQGAGGAMAPTNEQILGEIRAFCRETQTAESTFGRRVVNDGKLVSRLRDGARITTETLSKVRTLPLGEPGGAR